MNARMNRAARQMVACLCAMVCGVWMASASAEEAIPKHLQVARDIVKNVKPENNAYSNKPRYIRFPGDLFTSEYTVRTDCTGFTEAILDKAYGFTPTFSTKKFDRIYSIIDWVDGVDRGETFDKIERVQDLKPGDFVLWKYIVFPTDAFSVAWGHNGHILTVNSVPRRIEPQRKPYMEGAIQWEIEILDSSTGAASPDDTRASANNITVDSNGNKVKRKVTGAGKGRRYIYTNAEGKILGEQGAYPHLKVNVQDVDRRIVMARLRYNEIKK